MSKHRVAVLGADSLVGETLLEQLVERRFPAREIRAYALGCVAGSQVSAGGEDWDLEELAGADFGDFDLLLLAPRCGLESQQLDARVGDGTLIIDCGVGSRISPAAPLALAGVKMPVASTRGRVALPSALSAALAVALAPLRDLGLGRVQVSSYQAVSELGRDGVEELAQQTRQLLTFQPVSSRIFPRQIAFNCLPLIGEADPDGQGMEERVVADELRRLLDQPQLPISVTAVRVPVFYGHGAALTVETAEAIGLPALRQRFDAMPGLRLVDDAGTGYYPTAVTEASGEDAVFIGRLRRDPSHPRAFQFWLVADNLRQGTAVNAMRIAEALLAT